MTNYRTYLRGSHLHRLNLSLQRCNPLLRSHYPKDLSWRPRRSLQNVFMAIDSSHYDWT